MTQPRVTFTAAHGRSAADGARDCIRLICDHLEVGHLLPRTLDDVSAHAERFIVAGEDGGVVACAELAPLSARVAEVRSLVVDEHARGLRLGSRLIAALGGEATSRGFATLCAFTHEPGLLRAPRLHDRAAHVAAGEDRARLHGLPAVPPLRAVRGDLPLRVGVVGPSSRRR